jgi:uncharacterized protein YndB with AHSA1/START domain
MTRATMSAPPAEYLLHIHNEVEIEAPAAAVFEALLEQLGPGADMPDGKPMPMKFEPWPGGRWYRDLGNNTGHFWRHVQVIKPPMLLEISGPLFMSYAAVSHVQYRLTQEGRGTRLSFTHRAIGEIDPEHRSNVTKGWSHQLARVKDRARR